MKFWIVITLYIWKIKAYLYFGCSKCIQEGIFINGRVTYPELNSKLRNDVEFKEKLYEDYHKDTSPLEKLNIGLVSAVPLDYMHLVCLGVVKRLLKFWVKGPMNVRIPPKYLNQVSKQLIEMRRYIPLEFCRLPRKLDEIENWKAIELRQFLLYTGPIVLKFKLNSVFYDHFLSLSLAIRILLSRELLKKYIEYARSLLHYFVETYKKLYGDEHITHNVHNLIHLPDDAKLHGSLENFSAFKYENYLQDLKKSIKNSRYPLQQIVKRIYERRKYGIPVNSSSNLPVLKNQIIINNEIFYKKIIFDYVPLSLTKK